MREPFSAARLRPWWTTSVIIVTILYFAVIIPRYGWWEAPVLMRITNLAILISSTLHAVSTNPTHHQRRGITILKDLLTMLAVFLMFISITTILRAA